MTHALTLRPPSWGALMRLGRVSNLPTVWTNVLAATVLAGAEPWTTETGLVLLAMSLLYVGGMYLNDAFDRRIDARERPSRPIPAGDISAAAVFAAGFGMLGIAVAILAAFGPGAALSGIALAAAILAYDVWHKGNPASPVLMGACRALVYVGAAFALGEVGPAVLVGAGALLAHVVGLTYAAKQEAFDRIGRLWPLAVLGLPLAVTLPMLDGQGLAVAAWLALAGADAVAVGHLWRKGPGAVPRAVVSLIAAIALLDAVLAATAGAWSVGLVCLAGWLLTRLLQRVVPGT